METNKLVAGIVAAAIAVIVLAGVLMPALSNATDTHDTFTNDGLYKMKKIDTEAEMTLSWTYENPMVMTVDGVDVSIPSSGIIWYTLMGSSDYFVRWIPNDALALFEESTSSNLATIAAHQDLDITISNGTITFDNGSGTTKTITFDEFSYVIASDGDYVMKKTTDTAYVLSDSEITGIGRTSLPYATPVSISYYVSGTIKDGFSVDHFGTTATITDGEPTATASAVSGYKNLYSFSSINWVANNGAEDANVTYSQVIVPVTVTAEKTVHLSDAMNVILSVIPILIIVAVLLGVVAIFIIRRE